MITTVAEMAGHGFSGDNGPATSAQLGFTPDVAVDAAGNIYISGSGRIRKVSNGVINTIAGGGSASGDNGPATDSALAGPLVLLWTPRELSIFRMASAFAS